jgi:hypothetical protein
VQAANQLTQLGGPIIAGLLIRVDQVRPVCCSSMPRPMRFSFVVIFVFVVRASASRATSRRAGSSRPSLRRPRQAARAADGPPPRSSTSSRRGLIAMLPVLAVRRFDADPKIVGFFFAAFGRGRARRQPLRCAGRPQGAACSSSPAPGSWEWRCRSGCWRSISRGRRARRARRVRVLHAARERAGARDPHRAPAEALASEGDHGRDDDLRRDRPLGFLAVGQALQYVGMPVVFLAIAAGFSAARLRSPRRYVAGKRKATRFQRSISQPSRRLKRARTSAPRKRPVTSASCGPP